MDKSSQVKHKRHIAAAIITIGLLYVFTSVCTFFATRTAFPIVTNMGRGSLSVIPAVFTLYMPIIIFGCLILFLHSSTLVLKRKVLLITGLINLVVSIFNLIVFAFTIPLLYEGQVIVGTITPLYPLDFLIYNILIFLLAITILVFYYIDYKNHIITTTCKIKIPTKSMVFFFFMTPLAAYFFGEALFGVQFWFEEASLESLIIKIPGYLSFLVPTFALIIYVYGRHFNFDEKLHLRAGLNGIIILVSTILLVVFLIIISVDPLIIGEYFQWEVEIGLAIKAPSGVFIALGVPIIVSLVNLVKICKNKKKIKQSLKEVINE